MFRIIFVLLVFCLSSCTINPFSTDNRYTGSAAGTAIGAGVGVGAASLLNLHHSVWPYFGLSGAAVGYYVTSLRYDAGGVMHAGGQVFTLGDYVSINIPTDNLFEENSADFLPESDDILESAVAVLSRYPDNHILVSGNTSGFATTKFERKLTERRAREVANFLWAHGVNNFQSGGMTMRRLRYVGYGNYFPIANNIKNVSIRQNSRIQITAYPTRAQLYIDDCHSAFTNVGGFSDPILEFKGE